MVRWTIAAAAARRHPQAQHNENEKVTQMQTAIV